MSSIPPSPLIHRRAEQLFAEHATGLRRFLRGVLRDPDRVEEALQQTFVIVLERGHEASEEHGKGWLYKVAFHEALGLRRKQDSAERALRDGAPELDRRRSASEVSAEQLAEQREAVERVRAAVDRLPAEQREVLQMRIREGLSFTEIADRSQVPRGTALTRMRLALEKLRAERLER